MKRLARNRRRWIVLALVIAFVCLVPLALPRLVGQDRAARHDHGRGAFTVAKVIDGDTLELTMDGKRVKVRLIGVDTPETVHPSKPVERFGREASRFLKGLVDGKPVTIEHDTRGAKTDRYGRELLYLKGADGRDVNREIIARGFGFAYTNYPFSRMDDYRDAEQQARRKRLGLWGADPKPEPPDRVTVFVTKTRTKYHVEGCNALGKSSIGMPLTVAAKTRTPCVRCKPPTLK